MALAYDWAAAPEPAIERPEETSSASHARRFLIVSSFSALTVVCIAAAAAAAAAAWRMGYERGHAQAVSQAYIGADADRAAAQTGRILDRLAALGFAFVSRYDTAAVQDIVETTEA